MTSDRTERSKLSTNIRKRIESREAYRKKLFSSSFKTLAEPLIDLTGSSTAPLIRRRTEKAIAAHLFHAKSSFTQ
jgi:hypothetical protein